ncbi:MAG: patatin-like protein [Actinomycetota bacterium]|nr:patatin-like protein [Actinomycetota bacterium]
MTVAEPARQRERGALPERWATRELRLAVVCYGGVSLAIYMHGITKEIQKLVVASTALEHDQSTNPFPDDSTEHVYWDILSRTSQGELGRHAAGANIRVVVDIITGTSAGGINGIFLAKALTCNRSQDGLRKLWFEKGGIEVLLEGWKRVPWRVRLLPMMLRRRKPPLRGDDMCVWLHDALVEMNKTRALRGFDSLLPEDEVLDLYVPITDFHGYDREIPLYDPRFVRDRTHRHLMHFRHRHPPTPDSPSEFGEEYDHALAFAARATSSFPGAFRPVSFADYARAVKADPDRLFGSAQFFLLYEAAGQRPAYTQFVDGGVLDNFPFKPAIDAIAAKPAATYVDRRLLFIEPDPGEVKEAPSGPYEPPGLTETILGGYASIPRKEPILDDLLMLARRNENVLRVRDVIEASFPSIKDKVVALIRDVDIAPAAVAGTPGPKLIKIRADIEARALNQAGFNAATYLRVRIRSVLENFADAVSHVLGFPPGSSKAAFVAGVLRAWAVRDDLLKQTADLSVTQPQVEFLSSFDLQYHQRRVRFIISALSWLYREAGTNGVLDRRSLDLAKQELYRDLASLDGVLPRLQQDTAILGVLNDVFRNADFSLAASGDEYELQPFLDTHQPALDGVREQIREAVSAALLAFEEGFQRHVLAYIDDCDGSLPEDLLTRYLGFPFWDILVYPLQAVSNVGERDHVEAYRISPNETVLLGAQDLRGDKLFHFGAFFDRDGRETDYLWGRLDGAERLVKLLLDVRGHPPTLATTGTASAIEPTVGTRELAKECIPAFSAILREEEPALGAKARDLVAELRTRVNALAAAATR